MEITAPTGVVHLIGCGDRHWTECETVSLTLEPIRARFPILTVIEGGAPGADQCVAHWAADNRFRGVHWIPIVARWDEYPQHMRWQAAHDRNAVMLDMLLAARAHGHGVTVIAFKRRLDERLWINPPKAEGGTEDMIRRAWANQIPVWQRPSGQSPARILEAPSLL